MSHQLLHDVRVLDLTRLLPGPYATQLLGDLGAEVIKIEEPTVGDYYREEEPKLDDGDSRIFAMLNRNKKSVALDLKDKQGKAAFMRLIETADVVVEGFRPGVVERLGVDYESVREYNEAIVYCSLSGYGQDGPYEQWAGHDINYIGISGLLHMTGSPSETPTVPGLPVADFAGGMATAFATMVGLFQSVTTGTGSYFDLAMTDVIVSWLTLYAPFIFDADTRVPERGGTLPAGKYPCYGIYETADGKYVTLGAMEYKFWTAACKELGLEEFANPDDHFPEDDRSEEIHEAVAAAFAARTCDEWMECLDPTEIPVAPVNDLTEVWDDAQVQHRKMVTPSPSDNTVPMINTPIRPADGDGYVRTMHPDLGEHSRSVLSAVLDDNVLTTLFEMGVTTEPEDRDDQP